MNRTEHLTKTINIINQEQLSVQEAALRVEELKQLNKNYEVKTDRFQRFLDFLAQPVHVGSPDETLSVEQAQAESILINGYWQAIANRDKTRTPDTHNHLHIHGLTEEQTKRLIK